jgi:hypothetical protein
MSGVPPLSPVGSVKNSAARASGAAADVGINTRTATTAESPQTARKAFIEFVRFLATMRPRLRMKNAPSDRENPVFMPL